MPGDAALPEYCSVCGAVMAILASQAGKKIQGMPHHGKQRPHLSKPWI